MVAPLGQSGERTPNNKSRRSLGAPSVRKVPRTFVCAYLHLIRPRFARPPSPQGERLEERSIQRLPLEGKLSAVRLTDEVFLVAPALLHLILSRIDHLGVFQLSKDSAQNTPNRTLPDRNIYILSFDTDYQVTDPEHHFVVNDVNFFKDFEQDVYISGGASIYKLFMTGGSKLMPEIVVDCVYKGEINPKQSISMQLPSTCIPNII